MFKKKIHNKYLNTHKIRKFILKLLLVWNVFLGKIQH